MDRGSGEPFAERRPTPPSRHTIARVVALALRTGDFPPLSSKRPGRSTPELKPRRDASGTLADPGEPGHKLGRSRAGTACMNGDGPASALRQRFELRTATVGVIGMGYVGLPLSLTAGSAGFRVLGPNGSSGEIR